MAGVGDGITSMAVHPHLPILAIGSMGQVSVSAWLCFMNQFFQSCPLRLFECTRLRLERWCIKYGLSFRLTLFSLALLMFVSRYHDGFLGQRIGQISCVAFHPFQASLHTFSVECNMPLLARIDVSCLSRSAPSLPAPSTALSPSMELRAGDTSIDFC